VTAVRVPLLMRLRPMKVSSGSTASGDYLGAPICPIAIVMNYGGKSPRCMPRQTPRSCEN
jgi:hypothetical protein